MSSVEWVERNLGKTLTEGQARCVRTLCSIDAPYNLSLDWHRATIGPGDMMEVRIPSVLSTWDSWQYARLMFAGFDNRVRIEISGARGGNRAALIIRLHARQERDGGTMVRMPTAEEMLFQWRRVYALEEPHVRYLSDSAGTAMEMDKVFVVGSSPDKPGYSVVQRADNGVLAIWPSNQLHLEPSRTFWGETA